MTKSFDYPFILRELAKDMEQRSPAWFSEHAPKRLREAADLLAGEPKEDSSLKYWRQECSRLELELKDAKKELEWRRADERTTDEQAG